MKVNKRSEGVSKAPTLSSLSVENEKSNVLRFMNLEAGFYAYTRLGYTSGQLMMHATMEDASKSALLNCKSLLESDPKHKDAFFEVSDSNSTIIYQGEMKPKGKINFFIYKGNKGDYISNFEEELNTLLTNNNSTDMTTNPTTIQTDIQSMTEQNNENELLRRQAERFLAAKIFIKQDIDFFCLSEKEVLAIAKNVQDVAIANRNAENLQFQKAVLNVSPYIILSTELASGKSLDMNHVTFHFDLKYLATHCKLEKLFSGTDEWKKAPGKIALTKIRETIVTMYFDGRNLILNNQEETPLSCEVQQPKTPLQLPTEKKSSLSDFVETLIQQVQLHLCTLDYVVAHLKATNSTLSSSLESLTNGVLTGVITDDTLYLNIESGQSLKIELNRYSSETVVRDVLREQLTRLIAFACLSPSTESKLTSLVDETTVKSYAAQALFSSLTPTHEKEIEQLSSNVELEPENIDDSSSAIEKYNDLIDEGLYDALYDCSFVKVANRQIAVRSFLCKFAQKAGLNEDFSLDSLLRMMSDDESRQSIQDFLDGENLFSNSTNFNSCLIRLAA